MQRDFSPDHPELMDAADASPASLREQLRRLEQMNRWFGGHAAVRTMLRPLFLGRRGAPFRIADLATGFGDHPRRLADWAAWRGVDLKVFAVDRNAETLRLARDATRAAGHAHTVFFVQADVMRLPFKNGAVEASLCSLAFHHFSEEEGIQFLRESRRIVRPNGLAIVIDLIRGHLAYAAVWLLTQIWMNDPYTRHDGRLSVLRAFTPEEIRSLAAKAGWKEMTWRRLPWFRQAIVGKAERTS